MVAFMVPESVKNSSWSFVAVNQLIKRHFWFMLENLLSLDLLKIIHFLLRVSPQLIPTLRHLLRSWYRIRVLCTYMRWDNRINNLENGQPKTTFLGVFHGPEMYISILSRRHWERKFGYIKGFISVNSRLHSWRRFFGQKIARFYLSFIWGVRNMSWSTVVQKIISNYRLY